MEASTHGPLGRRTESLLGIAISPHLIAISILAAGAALAAIDARNMPPWLFLAAGAVGWSSAWSP